jgi:hypothetical protein
MNFQLRSADKPSFDWPESCITGLHFLALEIGWLHASLAVAIGAPIQSFYLAFPALKIIPADADKGASDVLRTLSRCRCGCTSALAAACESP